MDTEFRLSGRFDRDDAIENTKDGILEIPEGFCRLDSDFAYFVVRNDLPRVKTLIIPATVTIIDTMRGDCSSGPYGYENNPFSEILVDEENDCFRSQDGVLFSKDMKKLICYPCGKADSSYHVPEGVEVIEREAFLNVEHLVTITLPDSLRCIEQRAFSACAHLDFREMVCIYQAQNGILISHPLVVGCDYHKNAEVCYWLLAGQTLKPISQKEFSEHCSNGASYISDTQSRLEIMNDFCAFAENWDCIIEYDGAYQRLAAFIDVFYSEDT